MFVFQFAKVTNNEESYRIEIKQAKDENHSLEAELAQSNTLINECKTQLLSLQDKLLQMDKVIRVMCCA